VRLIPIDPMAGSDSISVEGAFIEVKESGSGTAVSCWQNEGLPSRELRFEALPGSHTQIP
jgi:hypothetical protein